MKFVAIVFTLPTLFLKKLWSIMQFVKSGFMKIFFSSVLFFKCHLAHLNENWFWNSNCARKCSNGLKGCSREFLGVFSSLCENVLLNAGWRWSWVMLESKCQKNWGLITPFVHWIFILRWKKVSIQIFTLLFRRN